MKDRQEWHEAWKNGWAEQGVHLRLIQFMPDDETEPHCIEATLLVHPQKEWPFSNRKPYYFLISFKFWNFIKHKHGIKLSSILDSYVGQTKRPPTREITFGVDLLAKFLFVNRPKISNSGAHSQLECIHPGDISNLSLMQTSLGAIVQGNQNIDQSPLECFNFFVYNHIQERFNHENNFFAFLFLFRNLLFADFCT